MIEYGTIISVKEGLAEIEISPREDGAECAGCGKCFSPGIKKHALWAVNRTGAGAGDRVKVFVRPGRILSALILYIFPLFCFFLFYFLSRAWFGLGELSAALAAFAGFGFSYCLIAFMSRKSATRNYIMSSDPAQGKGGRDSG